MGPPFGSRRRFLASVLFLFLGAVLGAVAQQPACPGVAAGACGPACQQETCLALQGFFNATHVDSEWYIEDGWELLRSQSCQQLLGSPTPAYCTWHGLSCCTPAALARGQCSAVNSIINVTLPVNALNGSIGAPLFTSSVARLHACGLAHLALVGNDLSGPMVPAWGQFTQLRVLDMGSNWLTGTLPELGQLQRLQRLELNGNYFHGPVPAWLNNLTQLEVLNLGDNGAQTGTGRLPLQGTLPATLLRSARLREVSFDEAELTGGLPDPLCGPNTTLRVLSLRNAGLNGAAAGVLSCTQLSLLDLSHNGLTGTLSVNAAWARMEVLNLQANAFSGAVPDALYQLPYLTMVDISNNRLNGTLRRNIVQMLYLSAFMAHHNRLSGSIPPDVFFAPALTRLRLDHNVLTGVIPASISYASGLEELRISFNPGLRGTIPDGMGALPMLSVADLTNTSLSCAAPGPPGTKCPEPLPCFLEFATYMGPAYGGIQCKAVVRKSPAAAAASCPPGLRPQLVANGGDLRAARRPFTWQLDKSYYQYQTCQCLSGEVAVWANNGTALTCQMEEGGGIGWWRALLVVLFSGAAVLLASLLLTRVLVGTRYQPRWIRQQEVRRKRAAGPPRSGMVSVVVTDIEGYSELMRYSPSLMTRALGLHNAVIRRASWTHGGHVIEQEGDSFSIAFHEPMDAVSFCLQAQQALMMVDWPAGLGASPEDRKAGEQAGAASGLGKGLSKAVSKGDLASTKGEWGASRGDLLELEKRFAAGGSQKRMQSLRSSLDIVGHFAGGGGGVERAERGPSGSSASAAAAAASDGPDRSTPLDHSFTSQHSSIGSDEDAPEHAVERSHAGTHRLGSPKGFARLATLAAAHVHHNDHKGGAHHAAAAHEPKQGLTKSMSVNRGLSNLLSHLPGPLRGKSGVSAASADKSARSRSDSHHSGGGKGSQHHFFSLFLRPVGLEDEMLFYGLRVRMGVATGYLAEGAVLKNSAAVDLAKLVSDAGGGGQVLMETATFEAVQERLHELGAVDGRGVNETRLMAQRPGLAPLAKLIGAYRRWRDRDANEDEGDVLKVEAPSAGSSSSGSSGEAVVLDMGAYDVPGVDAAAAMAAAVPTSTADRWSEAIKSTLTLNPLNPLRRSSLAVPQPLRRGSTPDPTRANPFLRHSVAGVFQRGSAPGFARASATAADGGREGSVSGREHANAPVHLYSILPPSLVGRAKVWGNALALKDDSKQVDSAYFDAPGTLYAEVDRAAAAAADAEALPLVTVVSVAVAGAKGYTRWRRGEGRVVGGIIGDCLRKCLRAVPGGYLCREEQEGMQCLVAFPNAHSALEWCLITQEAMNYQPWSASLLSYPGFEEVKSSDGRLLFRGPRLKMGVCEGQPRTILPDHMGRAEYTGAFVTHAVRLMESAAHGGQVVCELELAQTVFRRWRQEDEFGQAPGYEEAPVPSVVPTPGPTSPRISWRHSLDNHQLAPVPSGALLPSESIRTPFVAPAAERGGRGGSHAVGGIASHLFSHGGAGHNGSHAAGRKAAAYGHGWLSKLVPKHSQEDLPLRTSSDSALQPSSSAAAFTAARGTPFPVAPAAPPGLAAEAAAAADAAAAAAIGGKVFSPFAAASMQPVEVLSTSPGRVSTMGMAPKGAKTGTAPQAVALPPAAAAAAAATASPRRTSSDESADAVASLPHNVVASGSPPARMLSEEAQRRLALIFGKSVPGSIQRAASNIPRTCSAVEATYLGTFRFRGFPDTEAVAATLARLQGRRFPEEPPRPGTRIQVRSGVADGALAELPDVSKEARAAWEEQQRREEEVKRRAAIAAERAAERASPSLGFGSAFQTNRLLRSSLGSVLGSKNRASATGRLGGDVESGQGGLSMLRSSLGVLTSRNRSGGARTPDSQGGPGQGGASRGSLGVLGSRSGNNGSPATQHQAAGGIASASPAAAADNDASGAAAGSGAVNMLSAGLQALGNRTRGALQRRQADKENRQARQSSDMEEARDQRQQATTGRT